MGGEGWLTTAWSDGLTAGQGPAVVGFIREDVARRAISLGPHRPRGPSPPPPEASLSHLQNVGSSVLPPLGAPPSPDVDPSLAGHEGSGQAAVNVPSPVGFNSSPWGCAGNELPQPGSSPQGPGPRWLQGTCSPIPPLAASFAQLQAASFSAQPVTPSPSGSWSLRRRKR